MRLFAWAGAALFVLALARTACLYLGELGGVRPFAGPGAILTDTLLFTVFALHHSLFARERVKDALLTVVPAGARRSLYVWIASTLLLVVCGLWRPVGGIIYNAGRPLALAGWSVQLGGLALTVAGVRAIDPLELAGLHAARPNDDLVVRGAYRFVRHPLYLGWMLMVFAAPHMTGDRLLFAAISSAYLIVAIPWEERSLEGAFGDGYRDYKKRVPWRVLPFVY